MTLLQQIEAVFQLVVQYGVLLLECAGVAVLLVTAVKSMITAKVALHNGRITRTSTSRSDAPSICAASSNSVGTPSMAVLMMIMLNTVSAPGMTMAKGVSTMPSARIVI